MLWLLSFMLGVSLAQSTPSDYECFGPDPLVQPAPNPPPSGPNRVKCIYSVKAENVLVLARKVREIITLPGYLSLDGGEVKEFMDEKKIIFTHEDPSVMRNMLIALRKFDTYREETASDQIELVVDIYFLSMHFSDGLDLSAEFTYDAPIVPGLPRASTNPVNGFR